MAEPISTTLLVAKAAATALTNDKLRKGIGWIMTAIFSPLIVIIALFCGMMSGASDHNNNALALCFNGGPIGNVPEEYRQHIESMRDSFGLIDNAISIVNEQMEDGNSLDTTRIKAIFYSLLFAEQSPSNRDHGKFVGCFYTTEERTRIVTTTDEYGNESSYEETYTVLVPINNLELTYTQIAQALSLTISEENKANGQQIYMMRTYGQGNPDMEERPELGEAIGSDSYKKLIQEAEKYLGYPYVFGGSSPKTSFDCSGFVCWVYTQSGVYNLPRTTVQGIYNQSAPVSISDIVPGDLVFFTKTYATMNTISHLGIYVGNNRMIHCGDPISYTSIDTPYWKKHFFSFGRLS